MAVMTVLDSLGATQTVEKPLTPGRAAAAASRPVTIASEDYAAIGDVVETAPATDTASSGLNGRLQRIAQRLTSLLTGLGATTDAAVVNGAGGSVAGYLRAIKDAATDTTTASPVKLIGNDEWETVAASQTDQALGATGAAGDRLSSVIIIPATTSPGAVSIKDGAGSAITIFTGGSTSVADLKPFTVVLGLKSLSGAWKVTTGANVSAIGTGDFT